MRGNGCTYTTESCWFWQRNRCQVKGSRCDALPVATLLRCGAVGRKSVAPEALLNAANSKFSEGKLAPFGVSTDCLTPSTCARSADVVVMRSRSKPAEVLSLWRYYMVYDTEPE